MSCRVGRLAGAEVGGVFAARRERAAGAWLGHVRRHAGDGVEFLALGLQRGDGVLQGAIVRVLRVVKDFLGRAGLDDLAAVHDVDAVAETGDDAQVVSDEDHRRAEFLLFLLDQLQNLRLHGDVERRGRLVSNQDIRLGDQRHGDHHALAHAAGELVRIASDAAGGILNANRIEHCKCLLAGRLFVGQAVDEQRFDELILDAQIWIQRRHRILKNHRYAPAPDHL